MAPDTAAGRGPAVIPASDLLGPDTSLIYNDWYPAMRSDGLRGRKMDTAMLLGIPLVLGRKEDGSIFAMRDSCPHRGIPLSCGWFDGSGVTCKYHGWVFEPESGQCMEIPSLTSQDSYPRRIYANAFPCKERYGYSWVYVPKPGSGRIRMESRDALPAVPELPRFSKRYRSAHLSAELPCNVDHGIIGLMDPAHGPFVHQAWWWRSRHSIHEKEKHFEPIAQGFRMSAHTPSANSAPYKLLGVYGEPIDTTIDFVLPNRRYETLRCGNKWFASLTTVTPTTPGNSRSISSAAPAEPVFALTADFNCCSAWAPQDQQDPSLERSYGAADAGLGAVCEWRGSGSAGKGRMQITAALAPRSLTVTADFEKPFVCHNINEFTL